MRIKDEDFPTLAEFAERLELRRLQRLAILLLALHLNLPAANRRPIAR